MTRGLSDTEQFELGHLVDSMNTYNRRIDNDVFPELFNSSCQQQENHQVGRRHKEGHPSVHHTANNRHHVHYHHTNAPHVESNTHHHHNACAYDDAQQMAHTHQIGTHVAKILRDKEAHARKVSVENDLL